MNGPLLQNQGSFPNYQAMQGGVDQRFQQGVAGYQPPFPAGQPNPTAYNPQPNPAAYNPQPNPAAYNPQPNPAAYNTQFQHPGVAPGMGSPTPSAPGIQEIAGYENVTLIPVLLSPPPFQGFFDGDAGKTPKLFELPQMSVENVRESLLEDVSQHCCYSKAAARRMNLSIARVSPAFHYTVETYGEARKTAAVVQPYYGEPLDSPSNGPAPGAWAIQVAPKEMFRNEVVNVEVPHTAVAKPCPACVGNCRVRCTRCTGLGQERCRACNNGRVADGVCCVCNGRGQARCTACTGTGQESCNTCAGRGTVKSYIQLTIQWTNHYEDFVSDQINIPGDLIRSSPGEEIFTEQCERVRPIISFPDQQIIRTSKTLVEKHWAAFPQERILQQRHRVRVLPVAEVAYTWKNKSGHFFCYSLENQVYFPDYPQKCCCRCVIL